MQINFLKKYIKKLIGKELIFEWEKLKKIY